MANSCLDIKRIHNPGVIGVGSGNEVMLTPRGTGVCVRLIPAMARLAESFCRGFTEEEKETLVRLLLRFWGNANSNVMDERAIAAILADAELLGDA